MNLIEQYGGYEQAKEQLSRLETAPKDSYSWSRFIQVDSIKQALLEYRRENNIYEVGDLVIYLPNIAPEHDDVYEVWKTSEVSCIVMLGDMDYRALHKHIRHATDEEIKQGYRNSTGK